MEDFYNGRSKAEHQTKEGFLQSENCDGCTGINSAGFRGIICDD